MKIILQIVAAAFFTLRPFPCLADIPAPNPAGSTATVLSRHDDRIQGPQSCGNYAVTFVQPDRAWSAGTWTIARKRPKKILFRGGWARGCELAWSLDRRRLAIAVEWNGNSEGLAVYDLAGLKAVDPSTLVNLGLPRNAKIMHFYWSPKKWNKRGELVFRGRGDYYRTSEMRYGNAKGHSIDGTWAYEPDGTVRVISLKIAQ